MKMAPPGIVACAKLVLLWPHCATLGVKYNGLFNVETVFNTSADTCVFWANA